MIEEKRVLVPTAPFAMLPTCPERKISRREVKSLLMTGAMLVMSNWGVRKLVERVRRRAFELVFA